MAPNRSKRNRKPAATASGVSSSSANNASSTSEGTGINHSGSSSAKSPTSRGSPRHATKFMLGSIHETTFSIKPVRKVSLPKAEGANLDEILTSEAVSPFKSTTKIPDKVSSPKQLDFVVSPMSTGSARSPNNNKQDDTSNTIKAIAPVADVSTGFTPTFASIQGSRLATGLTPSGSPRVAAVGSTVRSAGQSPVRASPRMSPAGSGIKVDLPPRMSTRSTDNKNVTQSPVISATESPAAGVVASIVKSLSPKGGSPSSRLTPSGSSPRVVDFAVPTGDIPGVSNRFTPSGSPRVVVVPTEESPRKSARLTPSDSPRVVDASANSLSLSPPGASPQMASGGARSPVAAEESPVGRPDSPSVARLAQRFGGSLVVRSEGNSPTHSKKAETDLLRESVDLATLAPDVVSPGPDFPTLDASLGKRTPIKVVETAVQPPTPAQRPDVATPGGSNVAVPASARNATQIVLPDTPKPHTLFAGVTPAVSPRSLAVLEAAAFEGAVSPVKPVTPSATKVEPVTLAAVEGAVSPVKPVTPSATKVEPVTPAAVEGAVSPVKAEASIPSATKVDAVTFAAVEGTVSPVKAVASTPSEVTAVAAATITVATPSTGKMDGATPVDGSRSIASFVGDKTTFHSAAEGSSLVPMKSSEVSLITFEEALVQIAGTSGKSVKIEQEPSVVPQKLRLWTNCCSLFGRGVVKLHANLEADRDVQTILSNTPFNPQVDVHCQVLQTINVFFTNYDNAPMVGAHWEKLGFGHADPAVDLNVHNGVLNAMHMLFFVDEFSEDARALFHACHAGGLSFASTSIAITNLTVQTASKGGLNAACNAASNYLYVSSRLYVGLFKQFVNEWKINNYGITDFEKAMKTVTKLVQSQESIDNLLTSAPSPCAIVLRENK